MVTSSVTAVISPFLLVLPVLCCSNSRHTEGWEGAEKQNLIVRLPQPPRAAQVSTVSSHGAPEAPASVGQGEAQESKKHSAF